MAKESKDMEVVGAEEVEGEDIAEKTVGPGAWAIPIPDGAEFGGLPPGTYLSKCIEEPKESLSSKGEPQTEFQFAIRDPEYPEYEDREGRYWCSRKPKAWWNICQTLEALGVSYEIDKENKVFRFDPMDCVGADCRTVWTEQTFEGRTRSRIQSIVPATEEIEDLGGEEAPF